MKANINSMSNAAMARSLFMVIHSKEEFEASCKVLSFGIDDKDLIEKSALMGSITQLLGTPHEAVLNLLREGNLDSSKIVGTSAESRNMQQKLVYALQVTLAWGITLALAGEYDFDFIKEYSSVCELMISDYGVAIRALEKSERQRLWNATRFILGFYEVDSYLFAMFAKLLAKDKDEHMASVIRLLSLMPMYLMTKSFDEVRMLALISNASVYHMDYKNCKNIGIYTAFCVMFNFKSLENMLKSSVSIIRFISGMRSLANTGRIPDEEVALRLLHKGYDSMKKRERLQLVFIDADKMSVAEVNTRSEELAVAYRTYCCHSSAGICLGREFVQNNTETLGGLRELAEELTARKPVNLGITESEMLDPLKGGASIRNTDLAQAESALKQAKDDIRQRDIEISRLKKELSTHRKRLVDSDTLVNTYKNKYESLRQATLTSTGIIEDLKQQLTLAQREVYDAKTQLQAQGNIAYELQLRKKEIETQAAEIERLKSALSASQELVQLLNEPAIEDVNVAMTAPLTYEELAILAVIRADCVLPDLAPLKNNLRKLMPRSSFTFIPNDRSVNYNVPRDRDVWLFGTKMCGHAYWYKWRMETAGVRDRAVPCPSVNVTVICRTILNVYRRTRR